SSRWCASLRRSDRSAWSCGFLSFCLFLEAISPPRAVQANRGIHDQVLDDAAEVVVSCVACQLISGPENLRLGADVPTLGSASLAHVRFLLLHVESTAAMRLPDRWSFEVNSSSHQCLVLGSRHAVRSVHLRVIRGSGCQSICKHWFGSGTLWVCGAPAVRWVRV